MAQITDTKAFDGETVEAKFAAPTNATACFVRISDSQKTERVNAEKLEDGSWSAIMPEGFNGLTRWAIFAEADGRKSLIRSGEIYIRPLVSRYRKVVEAIENALENWGNNPNKAISVGEIQITYKNHDELVALHSYWTGRCKADEEGVTTAGGPFKIRGCF